MKLKVILIALLLFAPLAPSISATTPKAGAICSKAGITKTYKGKKYTCTKKGKKLVWSKGVVFKFSKPAPTPSLTPSLTPSPTSISTLAPAPAPTPTPLPSPSEIKNPIGSSIFSSVPGLGPAGRVEYRYKDGNLERKNVDNIWLSEDSRVSSDFHQIRVAAYESIRKSTNTSNNMFSISSYITRTYPEELSGIVSKQVEEFSLLMSQYLNANLSVDLVLVTEQDSTFIDNELPKIINPNLYGNSLSILKEYSSEQNFFRRTGTGGGTAGYRRDLNKGYFLGNTASFATIRTFWPQVAPHEMAHVLQFYLAQGAQHVCSEGSECAKWHGHFIEGSANTIGMAVAFPQLGWYSDEMDRNLSSDIRYYRDKISIDTTNDAISFFKMIESRQSEMSNAFSYTGGQVLWEYYVGKYGFSKLIELFKNVPKTENFNENLKLTIGIDKQAFYELAAPYFLQIWTRLSKVDR